MSAPLKILSPPRRPDDLESCFAALEVAPGPDLLTRLPFCGRDTTGGSETELQAAVSGRRETVDLPLTIEKSRFYANLQRRIRSGEFPQKLLTELREFLTDQNQQVWENSWVRFPRRRLSRYAEKVFSTDLRADKNRPEAGTRSDAGRFQLRDSAGDECLRVPISYLVKLALADHLGNQQPIRHPLRAVGEALLEHYTSDNTSPETFSFHVEVLAPERGMGRALAGESAKRYLFTQLLIEYANRRFGLLERGQKALIYFAPHPPRRQQLLNNLIPDNYYRQLFLSPCLSGWREGESKHGYMELCHQVLSRSQLNGVGKLREAGIILNNLVVLPNLSSTSLANNGVHISLGSRRLSRACRDRSNGYGPAHEKFLGDLATKIKEHFLPLFATTYSAAPYRLAFEDFHPEKALGFLPHQLDFTHLRMLWRRWKKKADLSVFGHALTPFGPQRFDRLLSGSLRLHGDLIPDFRLLDYPVCFLSTEQSPAYNGECGNQEQLKEDLSEMGVFDPRLSLYQFFKLREYDKMGFSGFEGRHYSLFPDFVDDLGRAAELQVLITALAFKYMATGQIRHRHIPDTPFVESERRQIFFCMAVGVPTFFVLRSTRNRFLLKILKKTARMRPSRRYPGYLRIYCAEYCRALLALLREDAADLIEMFGFRPLLADLEQRLNHPDQASAAARLSKEIGGDKPLRLTAEEFNRSAETYYRTRLRKRHMEQGVALLQEDLAALDAGAESVDRELRPLLAEILPGRSAVGFLYSAAPDLLDEKLGLQPLKRLLNLMLLAELRDRQLVDRTLTMDELEYERNPSVYRSQQRSNSQ